MRFKTTIGSAIATLIVTGTITAFAATDTNSGQTSVTTAITSPTDSHTKGKHHGRGARHVGFVRMGEIATMLGISKDALKAELKQGKSLADIANSHGIAEAKLISMIASAQKSKLDEGVKKGTITTQQRQHILANQQQRIQHFVEKKGGWHHPKKVVERTNATSSSQNSASTANGK